MRKSQHESSAARAARGVRHLGGASLVALLLLAPLALGAKGCEVSAPRSTCGGLQGLVCGAGEYCDFQEGARCGAADQTGVCTEVPSVCNDVYDPVCGCDGKTYANACQASRAGISVASNGQCASAGDAQQSALILPGPACGTGSLPACPIDTYCALPPEADCGNTHLPGTCTPMPQSCPLAFAPVCGCNARTYLNTCLAAAEGVPLAHTGACE